MEEEKKEKDEKKEEPITYFIQPKDVIMDVQWEIKYIPEEK